MSEFKYEPVRPDEEEEFLRAFESSDANVVANALYAACRSNEDIRLLEDECIKRLGANDLKVRWAAATCLGDLAFFRRPIDVEKVSCALEIATHDPTIADPARFSLSMVRQFSKNRSDES